MRSLPLMSSVMARVISWRMSDGFVVVSLWFRCGFVVREAEPASALDADSVGGAPW
jgi:hypothetical protein